MKIRENPQLSPRVLELLRIYRGFVKMQQNMVCMNDLWITFQIENFGCYKPTPLKMNLALEIRVG